MKPVKDLVDLVVLILTQTIDGSRLEVEAYSWPFPSAC